jgi:hypothetical protein
VTRHAAISRPDPQPLAARILDCFPGGSYSLSALLRVMDIVESEEVPTAAVECRVQPRLLVNPSFVARHAETPEKLLMLVMHELHHVLLGHTTLFPTVTAAQNLMFDAVINGLVCRMFPARHHTAFLTGYYDQAMFPHCLLRPPPGWPESPRNAAGIDALPAARRSMGRQLHRALYSEGGATYAEIFELLPKLLPHDGLGDVPLIGGHGAGGATAGGLETRSPVLFDIVREIVERWPQPPDPIRGRSLADVLKTSTVDPRPRPSNRALLRRLIAQVADRSPGGSARRIDQDATIVQQPLLSLDRRSAVLRALGRTPLLQAGPLPMRWAARSGHRVHVYLDVSGSMEGVLDALYGAILDCREHVHPRVHLFSTAIADVSLEEMRRGVRKTTGGTGIHCVARHMADNQIRRALLVTDGWVGRPAGADRDVLAGARLAVALLGASVNTVDLGPLARCTATLTMGGSR